MVDRLAAIAVAAPFLVGFLGMSPPDDGAEVVLRFRDPAIVESSGLTAGRWSFATVNDSGDTGRVFLVDRDGSTVGVTTWSQSPVDVEALAPGGARHVWVGDIGDNLRARATIEVARVPLGRGNRTIEPRVFPLRYPDGAVDAEALLRHPATGRLYVVTKAVLGGTVYSAPGRLRPDRPNRLRVVGDAPPLVTDGAFFPDGRHLVLRDYGRAVVHSFPDLERVGEIALPDQQQGEGIAVDADGRVFVSTEGRAAPVHEVPLPARLRRIVSGLSGLNRLGEPGEPTGPSRPSATKGDPDGVGGPPTSPADSDPSSWSDRVVSALPWLLGGAGLILAAGAALGAHRRR